MYLLTPDDGSFEDIVERVVDKIEKRLLDHGSKHKPGRYYTRRQLSELLSVDLATLHRWSKSGMLPAYRLGGKVYYKESDIEGKLERVPNLKDGRAEQ